MRAPLFLLTTTAVALSAVSAACFDWDGLLGRCQDAGNCLPPDGSALGDGGDGGGGAGDAGDSGEDSGSNSGQDGGSDAGSDAGGLNRGAPCATPQQCVTGACPNGFCTCVFNGPCRDSNDCCLGQLCTGALPPAIGTCTMDVLPACGGATAPCAAPGGCCSGMCNGGSMCDCSFNTFVCNAPSDCCSPSATCSQGRHCCEPNFNAPCTTDEQCCSRVCRGTCR